MTLKELIEQYSYQNEGVYTLIDIENLCKEYAKICLEKAAQETTIQINLGTGIEYRKEFNSDEYKHLFFECFINKKSIINIELP